ncbi:hypothetical protein KGY79_06570 [Candidatus Bipolaricaulota bacterium]|nr:hypothetical protein [Candidatus Bipolaricaulota bacterium]
MPSDEEKLRKLKSLLDYGINHNEEHQEEMKEWAETAKKLDFPGAYDLLISASDELDQVTDYLRQALEELKENGG